MSPNNKIYIHTAPVRLWHWINAAGFVILILTGLQIRYADKLSMIPLRDAVTIHNYVGFAVIFNYFLWLIYYLGSTKIKIYIPDFRTFVSLAGRRGQEQEDYQEATTKRHV